MKTRILTAIVMALVGVPVLVFSNTPIYPLVAAIVSVCCVWEMLRCVGVHKKLFVAIPAYLLAAALPLFAYDAFFPFYAGYFSNVHHISYFVIMAMALFVFLTYMTFVGVFSRGETTIVDISQALMAVIYIVVSFTSLVLIRYMPFGNYLFLLVFVCAWVCDAAAYFVGSLIGKNKLVPSISPKKTVEGAIGGVVLTIVGAIVFGLIIEAVDPNINANYFALGFIGLVLSVVAQVGDLWASLIKRHYGVKDFSNLLPGHGGLFDRFDSVLAVCTVLMVICSFISPFTVA